MNYRTVVGDILSIADMFFSPEQQSVRKQAAPSEQNNISGKKRHASGRQFHILTDIPILLKTTDLLIVNKPAGIPVHGEYSIDTLLSGASLLCGNPVQYGDAVQCTNTAPLFPNVPPTFHFAPHPLQSLSFKPGPLHRLDKDTTGVLCFSRTLVGAQWFSQCLREKTADKYYLGVVRGNLSMQLITTDDKAGKTMTQCYQIGYSKDLAASLVLFQLITGKKHQIRKHTMSVNHPLVGDRTYAGGNPLPACKRYLLHAWRLYFPASRPADMPAFIEAPLFLEMERCLNRYFPDWEKKAIALLKQRNRGCPKSIKT